MNLKNAREIDLIELQDSFEAKKIEIDKKYARAYATQNEFVYISDFQREFGFNYNYAQELRMYLFMVGFIGENNESLVLGRDVL